MVCNNAGVGVFGPLTDATHKDWQWVMNVNVWGVIHGIEVFLPRLIAQGQGGHIVNTASMAGLTGMPGLGVYCASKFAVVGLTESLYRELSGSGIGALGALPDDRQHPDQRERAKPAERAQERRAGRVVARRRAIHGLASDRSAAEVADRVVQAIRDKALYILTHVESRDILRRRAERLDKAAPALATA